MRTIAMFLIIGLSLLTSCGSSEKEPTFVGNSETKIVHRITCSSLSNMKEENKVMFKTFKKAKGDGYKACDVCNPDEKKK